MTEKKQTSRRDFFQNVSAGAAGMAFASVLSTLHAAAAAQQPDYYGKMDVSKLGNVLREPNVVEFKPWKSIHSTITSPMITAWGTGTFPSRSWRSDLPISPSPTRWGSHPFPCP